MSLSKEPGGFAEAPDGTLVHFIDLGLHAEAIPKWTTRWCSFTA
jgi:hypothetical protein